MQAIAKLIRINLTLAILLSINLVGCTEKEAGMSADMNKERVNQVSTEHGMLEGAWSQADASIGVFRGIPYAQPPVGNLRWRAPQDLADTLDRRAPSNYVWCRLLAILQRRCLCLESR